MPFSTTTSRSATSAGVSVSASGVYSTDRLYLLEETLIPGQTNEDNYKLDIVVADLKCFAAVSTADCVLTTNDAATGSPTDTINLVADRPFIWEEGDTTLFTGDITTLYCTNPSVANATLTVIASFDN